MRPELGEITVGQAVLVARSHNDMRGRPESDLYIPAYVVAAARVWIELSKDKNGVVGEHGNWRMRRDTQDEATQYSGSNARFINAEQHQWEISRAWALSVIRSHGMVLNPGSRWRGRETELAGLLTGAGTGKIAAEMRDAASDPDVDSGVAYLMNQWADRIEELTK